MKGEGSDQQLVTAVRTVLSGQIAVSQRMAAKILESVAAPSGKVGGEPEAKLTDRELEVLRLVGEGWSTEEIAQRLHISTKTVDVHRAHIKEKLDFKTTPEFLRFAIRWVASHTRPGGQSPTAAA